MQSPDDVDRFFHHPDCEAHDMGDDHPESPKRLQAIRERLTQTGLMDELLVTQAEEASRDEIRRAHPDKYIDQLEQMAPTKGRVMADPDTMMTAYSLRAARLAAGSGVQAVNQVLVNQARNAFCSIRPRVITPSAAGPWASASSITWLSPRCTR